MVGHSASVSKVLYSGGDIRNLHPLLATIPNPGLSWPVPVGLTFQRCCRQESSPLPAERQLSSQTLDFICPSSWPRLCFQENISEGKRMVSFVQISPPRGQSQGSLHLHYPLVLWIRFPPNKQVFLPKKICILIGHRAVSGPSLKSCPSFPWVPCSPFSLLGPFSLIS